MRNADLVAAILAHVDLDPWTFVMCGRVARAWRQACRSHISLLSKAARGWPFLTKGVFCGLLGLTSAEADVVPRGMRAHKTGLMYMYGNSAIDAALDIVGGLGGWEARLAMRAAKQAKYDATGCTRWVAMDRKRARPWEAVRVRLPAISYR